MIFPVDFDRVTLLVIFQDDPFGVFLSPRQKKASDTVIVTS